MVRIDTFPCYSRPSGDLGDLPAIGVMPLFSSS
jgi:hypothetical protein